MLLQRLGSLQCDVTMHTESESFYSGLPMWTKGASAQERITYFMPLSTVLSARFWPAGHLFTGSLRFLQKTLSLSSTDKGTINSFSIYLTTCQWFLSSALSLICTRASNAPALKAIISSTAAMSMALFHRRREAANNPLADALLLAKETMVRTWAISDEIRNPYEAFGVSYFYWLIPKVVCYCKRL